MKKILLNLLLSISLLVIHNAYADQLAVETFSTYVDKKGEIKLPSHFRQEWTHLGSWVVNDAKAPGHGFHDVYTQPAAVKDFLKTGKFPDGAVLVKEIRKISAGPLTTGDALWASENAVWFVMVKDEKGRFKGNANWGEGWGWALFEAAKPQVNASKGYETSCLGCHKPAQATDWVFLQGYPTLKP